MQLILSQTDPVFPQNVRLLHNRLEPLLLEFQNILNWSTNSKRRDSPSIRTTIRISDTSWANRLQVTSCFLLQDFALKAIHEVMKLSDKKKTQLVWQLEPRAREEKHCESCSRKSNLHWENFRKRHKVWKFFQTLQKQMIFDERNHVHAKNGRTTHSS